MDSLQYTIQQHNTSLMFNISWEECLTLFPPADTVVLTDYHVYRHHHHGFSEYRIIKIPPGESHKTLDTIQYIEEALLQMEADRSITLLCIGGGVVTDVGGLAAAMYKRGIRLVHMPSSLLAMVDASLGGKNGVNVGAIKNVLGTIHHPAMIGMMPSLLQTLPPEAWRHGFAEIIKHACIRDLALFTELEQADIHTYTNDQARLIALIRKNVDIKMQLVMADPDEKRERKCLNFGHTLGHAMENLLGISHGDAVSLGMVAAVQLSVRLGLLPSGEAARVIRLLHHYHLPVSEELDVEKIFDMIRQDKKRQGADIDFILLKAIGQGDIYRISMNELRNHLPYLLA